MGAVPPAHLTAAGQVMVLAVPSAVNINVNEPSLPLTGGLVIVKVLMLAFNDTLNVFPFVKSSVNDPADIVGEEYVSA